MHGGGVDSVKEGVARANQMQWQITQP